MKPNRTLRLIWGFVLDEVFPLVAAVATVVAFTHFFPWAPVCEASELPGNKQYCHDSNDDGAVTASDSLAALRQAVGLDSLDICGGVELGDCFRAHESPGCDDSRIELEVSRGDGSCLSQEWNQVCVAEATRALKDYCNFAEFEEPRDKYDDRFWDESLGRCYEVHPWGRCQYLAVAELIGEVRPQCYDTWTAECVYLYTEYVRGNCHYQGCEYAAGCPYIRPETL